MIPQIVYIAIIFLSLGVNIAYHGKEKKGTHNSWISFFSSIITFSILYWGGFFDCFF